MKSNNHCTAKILIAAMAAAGLVSFSIAHAADNEVLLDEVNVVGSAPAPYQPEVAKVGPLGEKALLDTPYSIHVLPAPLMENQQLKSVRDAFRYFPTVQGENIRPQTRGLQAGVVQNTRIDGMNIAATTDYPIEQFEDIQVLNGLAGALYGPSNPAGTFNYVLKRPTAKPLRRLNIGYSSQASASAHADLSGYFGESQRFGYRINLLKEGGEGYVQDSKLDRSLISLALDMKITNNTRLETNFSRYHYTSKGFPGTFELQDASILFPHAPDPKRVGYGQPFAGDDNLTKTYSARLNHRFNPDWSLTAGILKQSSDRTSTVPTLTLTDNAGAYKLAVATTTFTLDEVLSHTVALNGRIRAGSTTHDMVVSATGFEWDRYSPFNPPPPGGIVLGASNLNSPATFSPPVWPDFKNRYKSQTTRQNSLTLGDTVRFNGQWSAALFVSQGWIDQSGIAKTGAARPNLEYSDNGISTNATLSYKPQKNMAVYGSYADSLQQGESDPTGATILPPYRSKQWELGYKIAYEKLALSAALFRVERPFAFTSGGVFAVQGDQRNQGIELMANGALTRDLMVYAGLSYLNPKLLNTASASTSNKQIMGLPNWSSNVLLDYKIAAVPGLALNLNVGGMGSRQGNHANTYKVGGFTTVDLGARYSTQLMGRGITWRLAVNNATDKRYWANITPKGQNGYSGGGSGNGTLGAPRMVLASMQMDF